MQILKFSASWCAPCKALAKMLESTQHEHTIVDVDIDDEDGAQLAAAHRVRGVPTMVMLNTDGVEIKRTTSRPTSVESLQLWLTT